MSYQKDFGVFGVPKKEHLKKISAALKKEIIFLVAFNEVQRYNKKTQFIKTQF